VPQRLWHTPSGEHVREIELASWLKDPEDLTKNPLLVLGQVDDTI
jgi:hypothetical protein